MVCQSHLSGDCWGLKADLPVFSSLPCAHWAPASEGALVSNSAVWRKLACGEPVGLKRVAWPDSVLECGRRLSSRAVVETGSAVKCPGRSASCEELILRPRTSDPQPESLGI